MDSHTQRIQHSFLPKTQLITYPGHATFFIMWVFTIGNCVLRVEATINHQAPSNSVENRHCIPLPWVFMVECRSLYPSPLGIVWYYVSCHYIEPFFVPNHIFS